MTSWDVFEGSEPIDYLVIGGGAAGCVLASRLSERPGARVLLVERGKIFTPETEPAAISDAGVRALFNADHMWGELKAVAKGDPNTVDDSGALPYAAARVLGGGSSVNGMLVHRGLPGDYDEWSEMGVAGWKWDDVLPYFRKLETDKDFSEPWHGKTGPMPIQRFSPERWSPFERAIANGWKDRQLQWMPDLTGGDATGYGPMPLNISGANRVSAARAYLTADVRARPNLAIAGQANAERLIIENGRAVGAVFSTPAGEKTVKARNVILSAGAISSPTLLLRSGIGDSGEMAAAGITPQIALQGVGRNLQEHVSLLLAAHIRRKGRRQDRLPPCLSFARYSSGVPGCHDADMMATTMGAAPGATSWNPIGRAFPSMLSIVHKPYSRGAVRIDASGNPRVLFNLLSDERDLIRMIQGWQTIRDVMTGGESGKLVNNAFVPMTLGRTDDSLMTAIVSTIGNQVLDGPASLRKRLIGRIGIPIEAIPTEGEALRDWVRMCAAPAAHASGTCRMGSRDDANAVVDSECRVHGIDGLRVVDTSIFPTLMRSGTHIPTIMAAEKVAAAIAINA